MIPFKGHRPSSSTTTAIRSVGSTAALRVDQVDQHVVQVLSPGPGQVWTDLTAMSVQSMAIAQAFGGILRARVALSA